VSVAASEAEGITARTEGPAPPRRRRWTRFILPVYTTAVIIYLMIPIFVMILFGFNDSGGRINFKWQGFTLEWYRQLFAVPDLTQALQNSLLIAIFATLIATTLGTMIALALGRYRFRGQGTTDLVLFMNIAAPEVALGAALLALYVTLNIDTGLVTILIAHVMFCVSYVAIVVRARLAGFDRAVEEAAQDLGATPWVTFWKVTFPLIFPAILSGALLSFALSIDDYIITSFVSGQTAMFPTWIIGASRVGVPPQVNVMGTLIFVFGAALAVANLMWQRRAGRESRAAALVVQNQRLREAA
jgi:spermidine/putrescine transport system permease protein